MARTLGLSLLGILFLFLLAPAARAAPDAAVTGVSLSNRTPREGDRVTIRVDLSNVGDVPLAPAPVVLAIGEVQQAEGKSKAALAPGESSQWSVEWTAIRGPQTITATVDPLNDVAEPNEANNLGTYTLTVGEPRVPFPWLALLAGLLAFTAGVMAAIIVVKAVLRPGAKGPRKIPPLLIGNSSAAEEPVRPEPSSAREMERGGDPALPQ